MTISIIVDERECKAALYDTVTECAFGPIFHDGELEMPDPVWSPDAESLATEFVLVAEDEGVDLRRLDNIALVRRKTMFLVEQLAHALNPPATPPEPRPAEPVRRRG